MRGIFRLVFLLTLVALLSFSLGTGYAQTPTPPQGEDFGTGFYVSGAFLAQYYSVPNPLEIYGLPITQEFEGVSSFGICTRMQYFTKARFDLVRTPEGERVVVANLGELLYPGPGPLAPVPTEGPTCRRFDATGKSVCYAFLQFYEANNGEVNFGNPISDLEIREGRYVQYFEKVRMEWQPERQAESHVVLTDLGKRHFDLVQRDLEAGRPIGSAIAGRQRFPVAHAFFAHPLIGAHNSQTLYVVVVDRFRQPVEGAEVSVVLEYPDGERAAYRLNNTDASGITTLTFNVGEWQPRQVITLEALVNANGEEAHAESWFRIWY
ncbi:MAG: hypothetical protein AB1522_10670 [Chloroflexota bacterium]